jgi:mono/diheme cytochrome c family protein
LTLLLAALPLLTAAATAPNPKLAAPFSWPAFLGPFHMLVLHYPIGFLTLTVLLEARALLRPGPETRRAVAFALPLTVLTAALTAALGWLRAGNGEFDARLLNWHRIFGLAMLALVAGAWVLHRAFQRTPEGVPFRYGYRGLLLASFLSLGLAGHYGGSMTHGSGFLTLNAPAFVKQLLGDNPVQVSTVKPATGESLYARVVQPAFAKKCYACHGPEKQKGKFRLDLRDAALKGGDSGETIIAPADLAKSRLIYHLLLPREHDDAMPPKGKEPLTPDEIVAVAQWIQAGARFE